jgi:hypothetical protein
MTSVKIQWFQEKLKIALQRMRMALQQNYRSICQGQRKYPGYIL